MTKPKSDLKCRRCGGLNDNTRRHQNSGRRVGLCVTCDQQEQAKAEGHEKRRRSSGYAKILNEHTCEYCGKTFLARINNQRFCSVQCRNLNLSNWRKSQRNELKIPIDCEVCGATFVRKSGSARYCSAECRLTVKRRDAWINHLRARYRITTRQFDEMVRKANNRCEVCSVQFAKRKDIHVDHDHSCCPGDFTCGECVRGLVCKGCNFMLGFAGDDPRRLVLGVEYLRRYGIQ